MLTCHLNLMHPMLVTSLPNVFSFWGIYFIGGKVEKLINAPVELFHSKHKLLLHEIKVICQIDDHERILSKDIGTRPWEINLNCALR